jgi:hypothetical protein
MNILRAADIREIAKQVADEMSSRNDKLMNLQDVATMLGKKASAVRKMCDREQLPCHRHHGALYFSLKELETHLLNR